MSASAEPSTVAASQGQASAEPSTVAASQGQDPLLAQYSIKSGERPIGSGAFGQVFIGTRRVDGRNYALKHVDSRDEEWQREYQLLSEMRHDSILRAVEMFEPHSRRPTTGVIVTELYDMDLSKFLLRRSGTVTQKVARGISRDIALGLGYVHQKGIIHRDVKPQNVMVWLDADKGVMRAVLADFGLARWLPRREEDEAAAAKDFLASLQGHGRMMTRQVVTLWYRAPEILLADTTSPKVRYTSAIDVWSLGCVVYELVTGEVLARAATEQGLLRNIVRAIGPCPPPLQAHYGASIRWVLAEQNAAATSQGHASAILVRDFAASGAAASVTKTLQWKPSDRPACEELLQDAWMQASGGSQDSAEAGAADEAHRPAATDSAGAAAADEAHRPQAATDSVEAAAAAPRGDGLGGSGSSAFPASSQGQGSPWWLRSQVACTTWKSPRMCACSGHCYVPGHRYRGGCDAVDLLIGSQWCPQCACTVSGCGRPRLRGALCCLHKREWEKGPLEFVLTRCARKALPWLMPCDITDFVNLYPSVRHDKAFVIIIALLKEPRAIASFVKKALALAPAYSVDDLAAVLLETLDDIRSPTEAHRKQIQAVSQQGAGRFAGVASTCRAWGVDRVCASRGAGGERGGGNGEDAPGGASQEAAEEDASEEPAGVALAQSQGPGRGRGRGSVALGSEKPRLPTHGSP